MASRDMHTGSRDHRLSRMRRDVSGALLTGGRDVDGEEGSERFVQAWRLSRAGLFCWVQ
jgi:hypothetical protein